ncbi:hypothetical protein M5K25_000097 [Dendrobium thyrsiflorum]|uniref:Uncharacterized protein n=1 Tax=Dendrobium thyrsiflorum TaxID=117978 RepID=A0ABD0VSY4_DENTH
MALCAMGSQQLNQNLNCSSLSTHINLFKFELMLVSTETFNIGLVDFKRFLSARRHRRRRRRQALARFVGSGQPNKERDRPNHGDGSCEAEGRNVGFPPSIHGETWRDHDNRYIGGGRSYWGGDDLTLVILGSLHPNLDVKQAEYLAGRAAPIHPDSQEFSSYGGRMDVDPHVLPIPEQFMTFMQSKDTRELFYSFHQDNVPIEYVMHRNSYETQNRRNRQTKQTRKEKSRHRHKEKVVVVVGGIVGGCRTVQRTRPCPGCDAAAVGRRKHSSYYDTVAADLCIHTYLSEIVDAGFQKCRSGFRRHQTFPPTDLSVSAGGEALVQELEEVLAQVELPPLLPLPRPVLDGGERCGGCGRKLFTTTLHTLLTYTLSFLILQMAGGKRSRQEPGSSSSGKSDRHFLNAEDKAAYERYKSVGLTLSKTINPATLSYPEKMLGQSSTFSGLQSYPKLETGYTSHHSFPLPPSI